MRTTSLRTAILLGLLHPPIIALAEEPRPAILIRLDHPDQQVRAIIDLFRGSRAPSPPAAMAAWKRASREPDQLGKPLEAVIAAFNPAMADELRSLDRAEVALWFGPEDGRLDWGASLPEDDGTFAALATAFVLSGGAAENPLDGLAIDRLGPPGSALMAKGPHGLLVGGSTEGLKDAKTRSGRPRNRNLGQGIRFEVDRGAFDGSKSRLSLGLKAAMSDLDRSISGQASLQNSALAASVELGIGKPGDPSVIDPRWLDWLPSDRAMVAFAVAINPTKANWDAAFRLVDRVEKGDPTRDAMAPIRLRLDLLARTIGLRVDGDLLPHLRGVAGWVGGDGRSADGALLMAHLDDETIASRIFERVKPLPNAGVPPVNEVGPGRWLGKIEGRSLRLYRLGPAVVATWGEGVMETALAVRDQPDHSARSVFGDRWLNAKPALLAATWPDRWPGIFPKDSPFVSALSGAAPIVWSGTWNTLQTFHLEAIWPGLDSIVSRFVDRLPFDPPVDH